MAEFQWWLLIVGLVAGGGLVAALYMDARRREEDVDEEELRAEATWIAARLSPLAGELDGRTVEAVLRAHREYLALPAPDRLEVVVEPDAAGAAVTATDARWIPVDGDDPPARAGRASDGHADRVADDVGHGRGRGADQDLATARVQQPAAGQEADAGADREQRGDR